MRAWRRTTGQAVLPPIAAGVCPAAASSAAAKEFLDLGITHPVEIVGYGDLSRQEPQAPDLPGRRRLQRGDLHQRSARLGDDERLPLGGALDQSRQMGLGFVN